MWRRQWQTSLDGQPFALEARYVPATHELVLYVDDFPAHREVLPKPIWPRGKVVCDVSGHRVAVVVHLHDAGLSFEAAIDGRCIDTQRPEGELGLTRSRRGAVPGFLKVSPQTYYRHFPAWPRMSGAAALSGLTMMAWAGLDRLHTGTFTQGSQTLAALALAALIVAIGWMWQDYRRIRHWFERGEIHPAVVISLDPVCIVVAVDLALDPERSVPSIRVSQQPLGERGEPTPAIGDRLVAVVTYKDSQNGQHWHDIEVVAASLGCDDERKIRTLKRNISPERWAQVTTWWSLGGSPTTPGLRHVSPETGAPPLS